jgi:hypothetical protein
MSADGLAREIRECIVNNAPSLARQMYPPRGPREGIPYSDELECVEYVRVEGSPPRMPILFVFPEWEPLHLTGALRRLFGVPVCETPMREVYERALRSLSNWAVHPADPRRQWLETVYGISPEMYAPSESCHFSKVHPRDPVWLLAAHQRIMGYLMPPSSSGAAPPGYTLGHAKYAKVLKRAEALERFGQPPFGESPTAALVLGGPNAVPPQLSILDVEPVEEGGALKLYHTGTRETVSQREWLQRVTLVRNEVPLRGIAVPGLRLAALLPSSYLHLGAMHDGECEALFPLKDFAQEIFSADVRIPGSSKLYVADNSIFATAYIAEFLEPTRFVKEGIASLDRDRAKETSDEYLVNGRHLSAPWILWGGQGTFTSPHTEPYDSHVWVHLFSGEKLWLVFSEDSGQWESFVQRAGETVIMIPGVKHVVVNTSAAESFAIAQNFFPVMK